MTIGIGIGVGLDYSSASGGGAKTRYVFDDFNRANSPSSLGSAVTGQTWDSVVDTWGILNNHAYLSSSAGTSIAVVESLQSTGIAVQVTFTINSNEQRLIFRYSDDTNYYYVRRIGQDYELYVVIIGMETLLDTFNGAPTGGDVIRAELNGTDISIKINGIVRLMADSSVNEGATIHGMGSVANTTPLWDAFIVEEL